MLERRPPPPACRQQRHLAGVRRHHVHYGVTSIQRFGSALNRNVYPHILALDGVCIFDEERTLFYRAAPPATVDLGRLLDTRIERITRAPVRSGAPVAQDYDEGGSTGSLSMPRARMRSRNCRAHPLASGSP